MRKTHIRKTLSFKNDNNGNVTILSAFVGAVMIFSAGSAVDYTNYRAAEQYASSALDSATLAAALELSKNSDGLDNATTTATDLFAVNIKTSKLFDTSAVTDSLTITRDEDATEVTGTADLEVPTIFAAVFGFDKLTTSLTSVAAYDEDILEFSFVIDNTGSMSRAIDGTRRGSNERLNALKTAMRSSIRTLLPESGENNDRVRVAITPYSDAVNLGSFHADAVGRNTASANANNKCVTEREGRNTLKDIAPNANSSTLGGQTGSDNDASNSDGNDTLYETDALLRNEGTIACPRVALRPLTNNRADLLGDIDSFQANGFTGGHMGINWGFNVLSEKWQNFWPESARPANYRTDNVRKILVVMTDGEFNTSYLDEVTEGSQDRARNQSKRSGDDARELCDLAKDDLRDIEVYTIVFGENNTDAQTLLSDCASDDREGETHAFQASSSGELQSAFAEIIQQETNLRLTQ